MRRRVIILLTSVGFTIVIFLGFKEPVSQHVGISDGYIAMPETTGTDEAAQPNVIIHAVVSMNMEALSALEQASERFELQRPYVDVSITNVSVQELDSRYRSSLFTGEGPDILLYPTGWVRHEAAEGRLLPLDNYVAMERQSQWFETVRGAVRWNGYLWGVPVEWDPYIFVFQTEAARADQGNMPTAEQLEQWIPELGAPDEGGYSVALLHDWRKAAAHREDEPEDASAEETAETGMEAEVLDADSAPADEGEEAAAPPERVLGDRGTSSEALEAVEQGEAPWAFVPLSEAMKYASIHRDQTMSVSVPMAAGGDKGVSLPPFLGSSFVVSPTTEYPAESAEWIQFVTDPSVMEMEGSSPEYDPLYWPVQRSLYGLPATAAFMQEGEAAETSPLPSVTTLQGRNVWYSVRSIMRLIDGSPTMYGAPPSELPNMGLR